jgi:hypothetical protein
LDREIEQVDPDNGTWCFGADERELLAGLQWGHVIEIVIIIIKDGID